jgi:hypothetical protein
MTGVLDFFKRLQRAFGSKYLFLVVAVYGLQQGFGETYQNFTAKYFLMDSVQEGGLGVSVAKYNSLMGLAAVPWFIKAIYGMVSDFCPIQGYHRTPYLLLPSVVGMVAYASLFLLPVTPNAGALLMFLSNYAMASPDVMIDATVAEHGNAYPELLVDLQTLCWSSLGVFCILASLTKGVLLVSGCE